MARLIFRTIPGTEVSKPAKGYPILARLADGITAIKDFRNLSGFGLTETVDVLNSLSMGETIEITTASSAREIGQFEQETIQWFRDRKFEVFVDHIYGSGLITSPGSLWLATVEQELIEYILKNPNHLYQIHPRKFEELVAAIFANQGFQVTLTPQTRDGGVDIIAVSHSELTGNVVNLVECKRYSSNRKVGFGAVQRLLGAVTQHRAHKGILVTSSCFTRSAVEIEETNHLITLKDKKNLIGWLEEIQSKAT